MGMIPGESEGCWASRALGPSPPLTKRVQGCVRQGFFFFFFFFRAAGAADGISQARGRSGATAASLRHSHSHARSKPRLQPAPQLRAMPDP